MIPVSSSGLSKGFHRKEWSYDRFLPPICFAKQGQTDTRSPSSIRIRFRLNAKIRAYPEALPKRQH
ncbi:hypothetical protein HMPREF0762_00070 [Slackia exigua ATCC 700122]|uniref:Uncharacterized protein n=1 Tax=Slackia exigua (strain ATCC 700122 / DSM 15923 / CIP 105133 / JCM 11022 / KCTC 5966 / S-7) TaxID=649764 RepID=D0WE46_SLAES|nr:hypothetical protein HMPREF0762_00070 [Slackia exigua ATCC 700122]